MAVDNNQFSGNQSGDEQPALELIRAKLARIYGDAPSAGKELAEAKAEPPAELSRHQKFILDLKNSGQAMPEIQVAWHNYYNTLSDKEKLEVWQEFYDRQNIPMSKAAEAAAKTKRELADQLASDAAKILGGSPSEAVVREVTPRPLRRAPRRRRPKISKSQPRRAAHSLSSPAKSRQKIINQAEARVAYERKQLRAKHNLQSLAFGLAIGFVFILIFMFSFFNERFLAPFIHPGVASATPIIIDPSAAVVTSQPEIIIPKINVQIPLVFNVGTIDETAIEDGLENGVVHYPTTVLPGQLGNAAFFGHSSNNIFSPGSYKFAFVQLHDLSVGDTFYITYAGKVYVYQVYDKQIVAPSDVAVLDNVSGKAATATLITCDPPGTSLNRLVVWGEQISPSPTANSTPAAPTTATKPSQIAGNGPSLLSQIWPF